MSGAHCVLLINANIMTISALLLQLYLTYSSIKLFQLKLISKDESSIILSIAKRGLQINNTDYQNLKHYSKNKFQT